MRKLVVVAFFVVAGMAGGGYTHEMPAEVQAFLDNYLRDSTATWGPLHFKKKGIIPDSVPIKDLKLRVLPVYWFKRGIFPNELANTIALSEFIEPSGIWRVAVTAHNRPLYDLTLNNRTGKLRITPTYSEDFGQQHAIWAPLSRAYPESTGINPILLTHSMPRIHYFLYFEQLGPRKIYYSNRRGYNLPLDSLFSVSIETLDDSRKLIEFVREYEIHRANERIRLEKTKDADSHENNRPAEFGAPAFDLDGQLHKDGFIPTGGGQ